MIYLKNHCDWTEWNFWLTSEKSCLFFLNQPTKRKFLQELDRWLLVECSRQQARDWRPCCQNPSDLCSPIVSYRPRTWKNHWDILCSFDHRIYTIFLSPKNSKFGSNYQIFCSTRFRQNQTLRVHTGSFWPDQFLLPILSAFDFRFRQKKKSGP